MYGADVPLVTYEMLQGLSMAIMGMAVVVPSIAIIAWAAGRSHYAGLILNLIAVAVLALLSLLIFIKQAS